MKIGPVAFTDLNSPEFAFDPTSAVTFSNLVALRFIFLQSRFKVGPRPHLCCLDLHEAIGKF